MRVLKDICYSDVGNKNQMLDLYLPDCEDFSVFVYFHGGSLEAGDKIEVEGFLEYLIERGIALVSANYRMYPSAVFPEFIRDAAAVVAWVHNNIRNYGKCEKIYVGGSSAGGYLSMMLCFDKSYLLPYGINPSDLAGFIHDAGQPTSHFNVLRERGIDTRRVIVDKTAPLYFVGMEQNYAPMLILVSDGDIENRLEQTMLLKSTLKQFGNDNVILKVIHGGHCEYVQAKDNDGESVFGKIVYKYITGDKSL